jgi:ribonuclease Z
VNASTIRLTLVAFTAAGAGAAAVWLGGGAVDSAGAAAGDPGPPAYVDSRVHARDQYFPGTEEIGPREMRVIALGTGMPAASKSQAASSFLVQLGRARASTKTRPWT